MPTREEIALAIHRGRTGCKQKACEPFDAEYEAADAVLELLGEDSSDDKEGECPYVHPHTKAWCGYAGCREK